MKKIFLFLICILFVRFFPAQVDETKNYVYLFDGTVQYGNIIDFNRGFLQTSKIVIDNNKEFSVYNVKFYKNETGFFGNTGGSGSGGTMFAQCERKGNVNLFKLIQTYYNPGMYNPGFGGMGGMGMGGGYYSGGTTSRTVKYYYNKGFGDLKLATYKNLMVDLVDNKTSVFHLQYYKKARNVQMGCSAAAVGIILAGGAYSLSTGDLRGLLVGFGGGIGFSLVGASFGSTKNKHLKAAIDAYNK
jgi:hypothetical protein